MQRKRDVTCAAVGIAQQPFGHRTFFWRIDVKRCGEAVFVWSTFSVYRAGTLSSPVAVGIDGPIGAAAHSHAASGFCCRISQVNAETLLEVTSRHWRQGPSCHIKESLPATSKPCPCLRPAKILRRTTDDEVARNSSNIAAGQPLPIMKQYGSKFNRHEACLSCDRRG